MLALAFSRGSELPAICVFALIGLVVSFAALNALPVEAGTWITTHLE